MLPTLRQLTYLKLLAEHGSFSRAAEAAHVTQPTLSAGVQELERTLGAQVVDRGPLRRLSHPHGRGGGAPGRRHSRACRGYGSGGALCRSSVDGPVQARRHPHGCALMLPKALPALRMQYPELRLFLREDLTGKLIAGLKSGALDAALIALPYEAPGIETAPVLDDELLVAFPANHAMTAQGTVAPAALEAANMILLEDGHCLRDHALSACHLDPPRAGESEGGFAATSLATLVQMVGSGLGVSLVPQMAVDAGLMDAAPVATRPLTEAASRQIVIAWRAGSSRGAEAKLLAQTLSAL